MDDVTVAAYDAGAAAFCDEWLEQPPPADLQGLWRKYLLQGAPTVDIGSGSGRDADWLSRHGYPCAGFDASSGLVAEAGRRFPHLSFRNACLPALDGITDTAYANVICETVIMHLPQAQVGLALASLCRILAPGGTLFVSWRVGEVSTRDAAGRLYSAFPIAAVRARLASLSTLYDREETSVSSGKRVHRIIVRKSGI